MSVQQYSRIDPDSLERIAELERPIQRIRWWILPFALLLCVGQAVLNLIFESKPPASYLIATQISVFAFAFLFFLVLAINPFLRLTRVIRPMNRAELMAIFAALAVSAGISSFGLADFLIPIIAAPFNPNWNTPQRGWGEHVIANLNPKLYLSDPALITQFREGFSQDVNVLSRIPWMAWAKPLGYWMIFIFSMFVMFYSLCILFYESWARREKLVFPLARLPEDALPEENAPAGSYAPLWRTWIFWVGFLFVFLLLSFNATAAAGWVRGLTPLSLGIAQNELTAMLSNSVFSGIADGGRMYLMFLFIFTAIGIGYLIPTSISLSLWGYHLIMLGIMMAVIWTAGAASSKTFTSYLLVDGNFITSLGGGALLAFAGTMFFSLAHEKWLQSAGQGEEGGARVLRFVRLFGWGGVLLILSTIVTLGWMWWNGVNPMWGAIFLGLLVLMTVGLMRVVAEGGVHWFQVHTGPFHLTSIVGGTSLIPPAVLAPLVPIYGIFFYDSKTFIAPGMMNSFKMQDETRGERRFFHFIVVSAIVATVVASVVFLLYLTYKSGANRSNSWFFSSGPSMLFDYARRIAGGVVNDAGRGMGYFYLLGAAWVIFSVAMRRKFFWWLHPIGLVMMCSPLMTQLWFSFFIGWLCKTITVKYGGRHTFARIRPFFIGLIFGELLAAFFWSSLAKIMGLDYVSVDINRSRP